jgi:hypothetical protein
MEMNKNFLISVLGVVLALVAFAPEAPGATDMPDPDAGPTLSIDGYLKLAVSDNFAHDAPAAEGADWRGLSRLRSELALAWNIRLSESLQGLISGKGFHDFAYDLNGREKYAGNVLGHYENELELRETYVLGRILPNMDVKFGRQTVVWGKSDVIRVTDVLNPLDQREPGLTDLDDLRLPLTMTKLDWYFGDWNLSGIAVHEIRFDKYPKFGSDFFPYPLPLPREEKPCHGGRNTEYAAALRGTFTGWDLSVYFADTYWDTPHVEIDGNALPLGAELKYARTTMAGMAANTAIGNWIFKAETARIDRLAFFNTADRKYARFDALVGIEYYGCNNAVIIFEAANRHIMGFDDILEQPPDQAINDELQSVLRISRTFINETLELEALLSFFGIDGKDGKFQRFSAAYDINDAFTAIGGMLLYQSGDLAQFASIGDNDRLFLEFKYGF